MSEQDTEIIDPGLFEDEIIKLENKVASWKNNQGLIAFYGSSSFRLWSSMEQDLQPLNTVNLGFGGSSFGYCLHYFDRIFVDGFVPSQIVLYAGDNDVGKGLPPGLILNRFRKLTDRIRAKYPVVKLSFVTIKPSLERDHLLGYIRQTNQLIRKELLAIKRADMINVFDSMLNEKGKARPELYLEDQLHLNEHGYRIWKGVFRKHFGI